MIYLDSSALMKLIREEDETAPLSERLGGHPDVPMVTSELGRVAPTWRGAVGGVPRLAAGSATWEVV